MPQTVAAELRVALASLDDWPLLLSMLALACDRVDARDGPVRWVGGTYLPDQGSLLCIFIAPGVDAVRAVLLAANLPTLRIGPAIALPNLDPRRDAA